MTSVSTPEQGDPAARTTTGTSTSRAGRDLPAAIAVGGALGVMLIVVLVFVPIAFVGVAAVAIAVASWEVTKRLREADIAVPRIPLILGGQAVIWLTLPLGATGAFSAFGAAVLVIMVRRWRERRRARSRTTRGRRRWDR